MDNNTALLFVPFEDQAENLVVRINPETGLIDSMEDMPFREAGEGKSQILWITRNEPGKTIEGTNISAVGSCAGYLRLIRQAFFGLPYLRHLRKAFRITLFPLTEHEIYGRLCVILSV